MSAKYNIEKLNSDKFAPIIADEIVAAINDAISDNGVCNLVLSGGKTPGGVYRLLSKPPRSEGVDWSRVNFFWGDDRYVPHTDVSSNYNLAKETLFDDLSISEDNIFPIDTSHSTPKESAEAYDKTIRKVLSIGESEVPKFDIVLLGIGEDGHCASIFPNTDVVNKTEKIAYESVAPVEPTQRVTLSHPALFNASNVYFIIKGEGKAEVLNEILNGEKSIDEIPAKLFKSASGKVTWFLDSGSGKLL